MKEIELMFQLVECTAHAQPLTVVSACAGHPQGERFAMALGHSQGRGWGVDSCRVQS